MEWTGVQPPGKTGYTGFGMIEFYGDKRSILTNGSFSPAVVKYNLL
jgi:hypothetical protein